MEQSKFYQIKNITEREYTLVGCDGSVITRPIQDIDKSASFFNIQDAKAGDVLASNRSIFIFSQEYIAGKPEAHCGIMDGLFIAKPEGCWTNEKCYPATPKQRDALMKAMKDAGWKFDFEKKALKKIKPIDEYEGLTDFERAVADACIGFIDKDLVGWKQYVKDNADDLLKIAVKKFHAVQDDTTIAINNEEAYKIGFSDGEAHAKEEMTSAWSEEDEMIALGIEQIVNCASLLNIAPDKLDKVRNWLKSIKDRVACEANCTTTKQWSGEDEVMLKVFDSIIRYIVEVIDKDVFERFGTNREELFSWIKSIKDRYTWKPSDKQMKALNYVVNLMASSESPKENDYYYNVFKDLREQLKKLR